MRTRSWLLVGSLVAAGLSILACVGDEPSTTVDPDAGQIGDEGLPCFANGTCNGGLTCVSNVCVALDSGGGGGEGGTGPVDSGGGGDSGPVGSDDGGLYFDAGCTVTEVAQPAAGKISCNSKLCDAGTSYCCNAASPGSVSCLPAGNPCSGGVEIDCQRSSDCPASAAVCCMQFDKPAATCPPQAQVVETKCQKTCSGTQIQLCALNNECSGATSGTCEPIQLRFDEHGKAGSFVDGGFCQTE